MPSLIVWSTPFAFASAVALETSSAEMTSLPPSHGEASSAVEVHGAQWEPRSVRTRTPGPPDEEDELNPGCLLVLAENELTPPFRGNLEVFSQSSKITSASHWHMGSGYAAVGDTLKPPCAFLPMVFCRWL